MIEWTDHSEAACRQAKEHFFENYKQGWFQWPGRYKGKIARHYRRYHAQETDYALVELDYVGWFIYTQDSGLISDYKRKITSDFLSRILSLAGNLDISVVRELHGDEIAEDIHRVQYDVLRLLRDGNGAL